MRTPEEYLKVLIYYAKVKSLSDLRRIFKAFGDNQREIQEYCDRAHRNS